jgi:hypothetical protein
MASTRVLEMAFDTELGKTQTIRVYSANDPLTGAEVATAMDGIIAKNIFNTTGGELTGKISATLVVTDSSELTLV